MAHPKNSPPVRARSVRVRSRPLDQIDDGKLAIAIAILARRLVEARAVENVEPDAPDDPFTRRGEG